MTTIGEDVLILLLDPETGRLSHQLEVQSVHNAISGSLLMELALRNRIDTDLRGLFVVNSASLNDHLLDWALTKIIDNGQPRTSEYWVHFFAADHESIIDTLINRLIERGVLLRNRNRLLRFDGRYSFVPDRTDPDGDIRMRVARILTSDEIPSPREIMVISLANACDLWLGLMDESSLVYFESKINQIAKLDLIGQAVIAAIKANGE